MYKLIKPGIEDGWQNLKPRFCWVRFWISGGPV